MNRKFNFIKDEKDKKMIIRKLKKSIRDVERNIWIYSLINIEEFKDDLERDKSLLKKLEEILVELEKE